MKPVADEKPRTFAEFSPPSTGRCARTPVRRAATSRMLIAAMHRDPTPLAALCISGGGIRSATFALGAIQGLAERGLLAAVRLPVNGLGRRLHRRLADGLVAPRGRHRGRRAAAGCRDAPPAPEGELDPIHHLREYNSYMSPRTGLFSNDVWTIVAIYVRNILLNWTVLIPLLMAVLMVPRLYLAVLSLPERLFPWILAGRSARRGPTPCSTRSAGTSSSARSSPC